MFYVQDKNSKIDIPDESIAIQVCNNLDNSDGTFDREISALMKLSNVLECKKMMVITRDSEQVLEMDHKVIEIVPVWKWLLNL